MRGMFVKHGPFSKLKKRIENLFDPNLHMEYCCNSYAFKTGWAPDNAIPRFYVKLGKEIIWDFPRDFDLIKKQDYGWWANRNYINDLVRQYTDTPVNELLTKKFELETYEIVTGFTEDYEEEVWEEVIYHLVELFIAADRRLGKEKLLLWAKNVENPMVDKILSKRFLNFVKEEPSQGLKP